MNIPFTFQNMESYFKVRTNFWKQRKIFVLNKDVVSDQFRILHNREPHDLYRLLTFGVVKSGRL
jgi:hypothetical protein